MITDIMFYLVFIFISHLSFGTTEFTDADGKFDEDRNYNLVSHCINEYSELDLYIINDKKCS